MSTDPEPKIRKGLAPAREKECVQTAATITIPAGTILRSIGDDKFACAVGFGGIAGEFSITLKPGVPLPAGAGKRVVAS